MTTSIDRPSSTRGKEYGQDAIRRRRGSVGGALLGLALGLGLGVLVPAAVDDEADAGETRARRVNVKLFEFGIRRQPAFVAEGKVKFVVKNIGTEKHEFVVAGVQPGAKLATAADGSVDEEAVPEDDAIGEIENIKPKAVKSLTKRLDAGEYVLFCNIVEEEEHGTVESHYARGMHRRFTVG
jgi:uncharacterized cupredoxin-like copper-binding protein